MKTALQELIDYMNGEDSTVVPFVDEKVLKKATELLEKEREQIEKAYYRGKSDYKASRPLKSKQYYKEIYEKELNQNK
jgi:hypothetical protein